MRTDRLATALAAALAGLVLVSCHKEGAPPRTTAGPSSGTAPLAFDPAVRVACVIGPAQGVVTHEITARAAGSGGNGSFTYAWTFGDGAGASGAEARHAYAAPGTFAVTGTATSGGVGASCRDSIRVYDRLINNCRGFNAKGPAPLRVAFVAQANYCEDSGCRFAWDFGDGTGAEGKGLMRPEHDFNVPGVYEVVVTAQTGAARDTCTVRVEAQ
jgi:hypothetical protein